LAKKITFIDLRKEIDTIREAVGFYWVALRTASLSQRCTECLKSIGAETEGPNPDCITCLGSGYPFVDKVTQGFRYLSTPGFDFATQIGNVNTEAEVFIIEHDKQPKSTDYIVELELNEVTGAPIQPFKITRVFKIQGAFPLRGDKGRIEFWRCFVEERNFTRGQGIIQK